MKLLSEPQREESQAFLSELREKLRRSTDKGFTDTEAIVSRWLHKLEDAVKQFDSTVMIIVAVGMLKAGKSTLINLLARDENASPTGFGTDTTLRPALITMGDENDTEGSIIIYGNKPSDAQQQRERLRAIIDTLRGIHHPNMESPSINPIPLQAKALKKALCEPSGLGNELLPQEPLLVVVKVPYHADGKMLQNGKFLLDMPGLDSANAEISLKQEKVFSDAQIAVLDRFLHERLDDEGYASNLVQELQAHESAVTYEALIEQCDMVLCLQSSVSPLNEKACACLNSVLDMRSEATAWIVMNRMRNQDWLTHDCMEAKWDEQVRNANKVFSRIKKESVLNQSSCNLGEAFAGILEDARNINVPEGSTTEKERAALLERSGFLPLEQQLLHHLNENGRATRIKFCKQSLHKELSCGKTDITIRKQTAETLLQTYQQAKKAWANAAKAITPGDTPFIMKGDTSCLLSSLESSIREKCASLEKNHASMQLDLIPGDDLDNYLNDCIQEAAKLTEAYLKALGTDQVQLTQKDTNGQETTRNVGDVIGSEVVRRCMESCKKAAECVREVHDGEHHLNTYLNQFQPSCHHETLLKPGFMVPHYALTSLYTNYKENRRYIWFGKGRLKRESHIWHQDINSMVRHYCNQASNIVRKAVIGADGDNRCTEIICAATKEQLKTVTDAINTKQEEAENAHNRTEEEIALINEVINNFDHSMSLVSAW